jgi:serine/threonine protein kinase/WD40 repeat protein
METGSLGRETVERLAEDFVERYRRGERPALSEYTERYPEHAEQIRDLFPALVVMERVAPNSESDVEPGLEPLAYRRPGEPPEQIGDYRILREIGRGGMGVVYEAEQTSLSRRVALKVLPRPFSGDPMVLERFRREARAAAKLHHTNIVPVYEVGQDGDVRFYAMQFIQGQGLDLVITELRRPRDPAGSKPEVRTASQDQSLRPRPEHSGQGIAGPREGDAVEVSRVLQSILNGRFDPGGGGPERASALSLIRASALAEDRTTQAATGMERVGTEPDPVRKCTGVDGANAGDTNDSDRAHPPLPATSSSALRSSSSVVLPGGSQLSSVESGHRSFFRSVAQIGRQVAGGLAHAHARGIVHRDIKPSNLLLDTEGVVWIADFGVAKGEDEGLTQSGDLLGTVRYMSPERFRGEGDARADVYALGLTLYELLTLRPGFASRDRLELIEQIKTEEPQRPRSVDARIPRDLETIVLKAIEKDPKARYQSAEAIGEDLRRFLANEPVRARQVGAVERFWRLARRNPAIALLGSAVTAMLLLATVASLLVASRFNRTAHEAERARQAESTHRQNAEMQKRRGDILLADMSTSRGLLAGERGAPAEAVLWFAAATDQSATAEDLRRETDNRLRARNWMRRATLPVAASLVPGGVVQLSFQPLGKLLLVRSETHEVHLWSWEDGKRLPWAEKLAGVGSAQFSPDGASVALGFLSGEAQVRNVADGELLARIRHLGPIQALAFSPDGRFLAIASDHARVWDAKGQAALGPACGHPRPVTGLAFNRRGDRLITACGDKRARVFVVGSGQDRTAPLYAPVVHAADSPPALIDEDRILVTVGGGSELRRWDMATGQPVSNPIHTGPWNIREVVASPDGHWFATGGYYGPELYAADAGVSPRNLVHTNLVRRFAFSPDNTMLLSVSWDSTARLWSVPGGQPLGQPLKHMANVEECAWSHDARYIATSQSDGLIRVWQRPVDDVVIGRESGWGERPCISFDGRLVVPGLWHEEPDHYDDQHLNRVRIVATASGQPAGPDIPLPGALIESCVCGDNRAAAAVFSRGAKGWLGVWDVATARARFEPILLPGLPVSVAARPGSSQLAVICSKGDLLVIDDKTGKHVLEVRHEGWVPVVRPGRSVQVRYTPDASTLVSLGSGERSTVNVRDADSGRLRFAPLRSSRDGANLSSFSISADSRLLATIALVKNYAQVLDLATGRALSEPLPHPGDYWGVFSVRFSPDGRQLLTSHKDGQARDWDWQAARLACPQMNYDDETHDAAFTPDGRFALTALNGRPEIHVWEVTMGRRVAPPVRLGPVEGGWSLRLAITPDGRRALATFHRSTTPSHAPDLAVIDLEELLSPCDTPTADLALLAELATSETIELGDLRDLTTEQWQERWDLRAGRTSISRGPSSSHSDPPGPGGDGSGR